MFIKLTKLDGSPIWLNASFVVTVEPRKGGGAIVVPIGDGLDYDVRESPAAVLEILAGAPVPQVVPVPASDALTKVPEDVSPEAEEPERKAPPPPPRKAPPPPPRKAPPPTVEPPAPSPMAEPPASSPEAPAAEASSEVPSSAVTAEPVASVQVPVAEPPAEPAATAVPAAVPEEKPAKKATRAKSTAKRAAKPRVHAKKTPLSLDDAQIERLQKMAPGSTKKLANTLATQFKSENPDETVKALEEHGVIIIDKDHVIWQ